MEFATHCHRCNLRLAPGVAYFQGREGQQGEQATGSAPEPSQEQAPPQPRTDEEAISPAPTVRYDHRSVTCLPMDLERVARAEAVDGWALLDTTIAPDSPGSIVANFRRPARSAQATGGAGASRPATPAATRHTEGRPTEHGTAASARSTSPLSGTPQVAPTPASHGPQPSSGPGQVTGVPSEEPASRPDFQYVLYVMFLLIGVIALVRLMGPIGILVALLFLPGVIRGALGMPKRKAARRSHRRRNRSSRHG
ncbi:MAG: hypothetical protein ACK2T6_05410 [Anaerolineae bacterium]